MRMPTRAGRAGQGGRRLLIGGIAAVAVLAVLAVTALVLLDDSDGEVAAGDTTVAVDVHEMGVQLGACLESTEYVYDNILRQVPCDVPHMAQVVAEREVDDAEFEGRSTYITQAEEFCLPTSYQLVPDEVDPEPLVMRTISPTVGSWEDGDRMIRCVLSVEGEHHLTGNFLTETVRVHNDPL